MERKWKAGDKLYRFGFDLPTGRASEDIFVIEDVSGPRAKAVPVDEGSTASLRQGVYFRLGDVIGVVTTKSTKKYVVLGEDDQDEARRLVLEYLETRLEARRQELERLEAWVTALKGGC